MLRFPPDFLWGTATAAHQVEGQNFNNDWWDWEQTPGHIRNGDTSRVACEWWKGRWREDLDRAQSLGQNAHRLSVEWSRIEPREGEWDDAPLQTYRAILRGLRERQMEPFVTLLHFTHPRWFLAKGGWLHPDAPLFFARFVTHVANALGDLCRFWITLNEPNLYFLLNYVWKGRPPGAGSIPQALRVARQLLVGHVQAYRALHRVQPSAQVSLAHHARWIVPAHPNSPFDRLAARLGDYLINEMFLIPLRRGVLPFPIGRGEKLEDAERSLDFVGLNYYFADCVTFDASRPGSLFARNLPARWLEDTPFATYEHAGNIFPAGLYHILKRLAVFALPIYLTENGVFDISRDNQSSYLVSHLRWLHRAYTEGIDVRGYFWWTLVDNFEWDQGYWLRFGLYHLDLGTQTRTQRPVADIYARIAREGGIPDDLLEQYGREN